VKFEDEKNASGFFEIDSPSHARGGEKKNASGFFEFRQAIRTGEGEERIRVLRSEF
jgi:hypothetical protein